MAEPRGRMVDLLSLLRDGHAWHVAELASELGMAPRTLRRDIHRLRDLGYPVARSPGGSYQLVTGHAMPPLLLTDDEAIATAVGLRFAMLDQIEDTTDAAESALRKLEQILPPRLGHRMEAALASTESATPPTEPLDPRILRQLATSAYTHQHVRFHYIDRADHGTQRQVEPYHQVLLGRHWYLLSWDLDRQDWRTYRIDRITELTVLDTVFTPRELPSGGAVRFVGDSVQFPVTRQQAMVRFHASASVVAERLMVQVGSLEPIDDHTCRYVASANSWEWLTITLATVDVPYTIEGPPELIEYTQKLARNLAQAADIHPR